MSRLLSSHEALTCLAKHIKFLSSHNNCTAELRDLLVLVQERMLVVDVEKRADSKEIWDSMKGKVPM